MIYLAAHDNYYYEPKRGMRFVLRFVFDGLLGTGNALFAQNAQDFQVALALATLSTARPNIAMNSITTDRLHEQFKVVGKPLWQDITIAFYDFEDEYSASEIMWRWTLCQYNPQTGIMGYPSEYKADANLVMLTPKGTILENWSIRGIYPDGFPSIDLNYTSGDALQLSVNFKYDWAMKDRETPGQNTVQFPRA